MKNLYALLSAVLLFVSGYGQTILVSGPAASPTYLVPFTSQCLNTAVQNANTCSGGVVSSFNFTAVQCCACPTSGMICAPGSVAYGGPGTSGSFTNYHTLSYSPSNEHQQFVFSVPINKFQFSVAGPAGSSEIFQAQTYNGAVLQGTHTFATGGTGIKLTYAITGPAFTRVQFTEINAISADDELFGDIYINGSACPILPFELLHFSAQPMNDHEVEVNWETSGEIDNELFVAEHSADGANWSEVASVAGAGTSSTTLSYQVVDRFPFPGMSHYRLRAIDSEGNSQYSQVVAVNMNQDRERVVVFPNPAGDWLHFNFGNISGEIELSFVNQLGQVVKHLDCTESLAALEVTELPAGLYILRITLPDGKTTQQPIVKK